MTDLTGRVAAVTIDPLGDELAADAASGALTLTLDDAVDFNEDGGTLLIGAQVVDYTDVVDETGVLTLAAPLTTAALAGDRVDVWDPVEGIVPVEAVAHVAVEGDELADDTLEALIDHSLIPFLAEGIRDGEGEAVALEWRGDDLFVVTILGRTPTFDSGVLIGTPPDSIFDDTALKADLDAATAQIDTAAANAQAALDAAAAAVDGIGNASNLTEGVIDLTAVTVRTGTTGPRVVIAGGGIVGYDAAGAPKTVIDATTGKITAVDGEFTGKVTATEGEITGILDLAGTGVLRTNATGQRVQFGTSGIGAYGVPGQEVDAFGGWGYAAGIALDKTNGRFFVADSDTNSVRKMDLAGTRLNSSANGYPSLPYPTSVAVGPDGGYYVGFYDEVYTLRKYSALGALQSTVWTTAHAAWDVDVDASGNVYILDRTDLVVRKFNSSGTLLTSWSVGGVPDRIVAAPSGTVYVLCGSTVRPFSNTGTAGTTWSVGTGNTGGIAVDDSGNLWTSDRSAYTIRQWSPTGSALTTFVVDFDAIGDVFATGGYVWVEDYTSAVLHKYTLGNDLTFLVDSTTGLQSATRLSVSGTLDADVIKAQTIVARDRINIVGPALMDTPVLKTYSVKPVSPFSGTVTLTRASGIIYASGGFSRASGSSTSFTDAGYIDDPAFCPALGVNFTGAFFGTADTWTIVIAQDGTISIRMSGASTLQMGLGALAFPGATS